MTSLPAGQTIDDKIIIRNPIIVRRARPADVDAVVALADAASTAAHWPRTAYDAYCMALPQEDSIPTKALFVACMCAGADQIADIVGFIALSALLTADSAQIASECEMENMVVAEPWRRQGVGQRLVTTGLLWCGAQLGSVVRLEVRASNVAAIALYELAGFTVAGRRPAYYSQPVEDAVLLQKALYTFPGKA